MPTYEDLVRALNEQRKAGKMLVLPHPLEDIFPERSETTETEATRRAALLKQFEHLVAAGTELRGSRRK
jgi:hypothetical protein